MKQYIHVTKEVRQKLTKIFGCTERTVFNALQFAGDRGNSDLSKRIRKAAYENYGILMNEIPAMETLYDHEGYMRQYFPNGAMLEIGKTEATKGGAVFFKGVKVKHFDEVMCDELESIQNWAMTLR
jgi:hypothetical protein